MRILILTTLLLSTFFLALPGHIAAQMEKSKTVKYDYETVPGDPLGVKIYTLENGMKLYMSVNKNEPRIQTAIAVRAGSKNDPAETTGLAHYLEHMLFKGTDKVGALNWELEEVMLKNISMMYEEYRNETDPEKRKEIYNRIDRLSNKAAELVAANEYDKMVASLGAQGTNAYTSVEQTVYINNIPTNELERWMKLESERFRKLVLRLFHTELEAVYEEFNIGQDNDYRKVNKAIGAVLFPSHPYGTQTTIGTGEHLKNPSHVKIQEYFQKYYIPNNMAIILAGDFNPDDVVGMVENYFGDYEKANVPRFSFDEQPEIKGPVRREVMGQESPFIDMAWRLGGANTDDPLIAMLISGILENGQAGLLDINLKQKQKVLNANTWMWPYKDYSVFGISAEPREGQSLEELEDLLMAEVEKIKKGDFEEWLIGAVIKDMKLRDIRSNESNWARVSAMTNAFVKDVEWEKWVNRFKNMSYIGKDKIVSFARKHFNDNRVVVFKRSGEDEGVYKVEKPEITPVSLNRGKSSAFAEAFMKEESPRLSPVFINYEEAIQSTKISGDVMLDYIKNTSNETFSLYYILEMGRYSDKKLPLAVDYLEYLGTNKYTAEQLKEEFFRLGLNFSVNSGAEQVYVTLSGLEESFKEGVKLFEHILANVKGDEAALKNMINDILLDRENLKKNKRAILRGAMSNYVRYGEDSPFTDILSKEELEALTSEELMDMIKSLTSYEHRVFYYGTREMKEVADFLKNNHKVPGSLKPVIKAKDYPEEEINETMVYFVDFPMVQAEILMLSKGTDNFNLDEYLMSDLYNNYFGYGLSSIVFQEIRESRALAYTANAYYSSPSQKDKSHYLQAYVGTQADKLVDAIPAMQEIIEEMPVSEEQIENARQSILKGLESERIINTSVYWNYRANKRRGIERDLRQDMYNTMQKISVDDLKKFHAEKVKGRKYAILVLGSKESIPMGYLETLGPVKELSLEEIFGY
jgi:predicted Zn-dependent peptidase